MFVGYTVFLAIDRQLVDSGLQLVYAVYVVDLVDGEGGWVYGGVRLLEFGLEVCWVVHILYIVYISYFILSTVYGY